MVLAGAILVVWPWGLGETRELWGALEKENVAVRWARWALRADATADQRADDLARAEALYRESLAADPTRWRQHRDLQMQPRQLALRDRPEAPVGHRRLQRHGHEAYLVGGCVRDLLLGKWIFATLNPSGCTSRRSGP